MDTKHFIHRVLHKNNRKDDYHISFCITCKGRLWQLEQTLLRNLADNADYDRPRNFFSVKVFRVDLEEGFKRLFLVNCGLFRVRVAR